MFPVAAVKKRSAGQIVLQITFILISKKRKFTDQFVLMRALFITSVLIVTGYTANAQQFNADELLHMLSYSDSKAEMEIKKKKYIFSGLETKGDTTYKTFVVRPSYSKKSHAFADHRISFGWVQEDQIIIYNTTKQEEFSNIKKVLEKKHYVTTRIFDECPPFFFSLRNKAYTVTSQTFKQDTLTWYSFLFHKKNLPERHTLAFAEDLLQFESHEYLAAVFGAKNLTSDLYYFSNEEVNRCTVLYPNTPMQVVFLWEDELNLRKLSSVIIGGRDELRKPSDPKTETILSENKWPFQQNIYLGMSLQQIRMIHGADFDFFGANSKYTGLIRLTKNGAIPFDKHHFILGCLNCKESYDFRTKEIMSADEAVRKGLILYLSTIILIPERKTE